MFLPAGFQSLLSSRERLRGRKMTGEERGKVGMPPGLVLESGPGFHSLSFSLSVCLFFFSSSLPVGPACPLTVSPQLAKKDPTAHWGSACPFWTNSSILVNMYILPFEFSISEPGVTLTLAFSELLRWALHGALGHAPSLGGHIHRHSRETAASFQVPGWL